MKSKTDSKEAPFPVMIPLFSFRNLIIQNLAHKRAIEAYACVIHVAEADSHENTAPWNVLQGANISEHVVSLIDNTLYMLK